MGFSTEGSNLTRIALPLKKKNVIRTANTQWKNLISFEYHLNEEKSILSDKKAETSSCTTGAEDSYLCADAESPTDFENNCPLVTTTLKTPPRPAKNLHSPQVSKEDRPRRFFLQKGS